MAGWKANRRLVIQNVILLLINILGVWRWLPTGREGGRNFRTQIHGSFVRKD